MSCFLGYVAVFAAGGVVLDLLFGARLLTKIEQLLTQTEQTVISAIEAGVKAEFAKLTKKL